MGFSFYPPRSLIRGELGLNYSDYLQNVDYHYLLKAENLYFGNKTVRRRPGFSRFSTESWSAADFRRGCDYVDRYGNARLLVGRNGGSIEEIQSAAAHTTIKSGLSAADLKMVTAFGACFAVNGADALLRIDGGSNAAVAATCRNGGTPAAPTNFAVTLGAAGVRTGTYLLALTTVIESGGTRLLESNWSAIQTAAPTADKLNLAWDNPASTDARATHVYLYATADGGKELYFVRSFDLATYSTGFTGEDTADTSLSVLAPSRNRRTAPPTGLELIEISGTRLCGVIGSTLYFSPPGANSYDIEAMPDQVQAPIAGKIRAIKTVPSSSGNSATNSLWFGGPTSCGFVPQSDPKAPIVMLSQEVGVISDRAVAARGRWLFWVDPLRGVMWWPGEGLDVYPVGERIKHVIIGGGPQSLTANQGNDHVQLVVWGDMLLLSVRDDSSKDCANKVYKMNLLAFQSQLQFKGPANSAIWIGPSSGPGFHHLIPRADGALINLDNEYRTITYWDTTTFRDYLAGTATVAAPRLRFGPAGMESPEANKHWHRAYFFGYHAGTTLLRAIGEEGRFDLTGIQLRAQNFSDIPLIDIPSIDLPVISESGRAEGPLDWSAWAVWAVFELYTEDETNDWIFAAFRVSYTKKRVMRYD
jgi:hypothetical protein